MNMNNNLLKSKLISPIGKLILTHIIEYPSWVDYNITSSEIAREIGSTRCQVLHALEELEANGWIITKAKAPIRKTRITQKTKNLIELFDEFLEKLEEKYKK